MCQSVFFEKYQFGILIVFPPSFVADTFYGHIFVALLINMFSM